MAGLFRSGTMGELTSSARRRVLADLKRLQDEPLPLASAQPCSDADLSLWDGVIGVEMDVTHFGRVTVPLHFLIDFPGDYPQSAPNIGFSFDFEYRGGASYMMPDGRLKGKKVICLDVLGNFSGIHTEWKNSVGSGWSPAYTVTTLLVQLQSVLCDLGRNMSQSQRDVTYQSAVRFCEQNPAAVLELLDEDDLRERKETQELKRRISKICGGSEDLGGRVQKFMKQEGFAQDASKVDCFLQLLTDVACVATNGEHILGTDSKEEAATIDRNICCFATGKLYTEALLGVGVSRERRNLATAGELLSKEAYDGGLRQSTNKSPFEFFLPVWINEKHAASSPSWRHALEKSYVQIGQTIFETQDDDAAILEVFPRLINQMIVEMMKPDAAKSAAIATFEALCNFWRTLRWLVDTKTSLRKRIAKTLSRFVTDEAFRHKDNSPDLGMLLVLFTVFQGHDDCPEKVAFINAYADENRLRWVMWWQRSYTPPKSEPVFEATRVSREICMFQMMIVELVIGDVPSTLKAMEATNCTLPERLEKLQLEWRNVKQATTTWSDYFTNIGASEPKFSSIDAWIADSVARASTMGPKYGGSKGGSKGVSKGNKGEGKSDGKGSKGGKASKGWGGKGWGGC
eukprot:TRINITY_DN26057_c0_g6_i1.p1 TRINITY_DN26057_c0_g6~~TRINITY_DN26057_c0_g6_i1.p1  ORF type:complete len:628 (-),score=104.74 TRINITY_DN26057_c0_g6_i1:271-2154(-)